MPKAVKLAANLKKVTNIKITAYDLDGNIKDVTHIKNLITKVGLNMIRDALHAVGDVADCEIKYVELGTGNTAPALTDVALDAYFFRKIMTSTDKPADYQTSCTVYISPTEGVAALEEIGWWAGTDCAAGEATGILYSRVLYPRNKTALESLQIERTDTITEG